MKKLLPQFILLCLFSLSWHTATAYDFVVDGIYYGKGAGNNVYVTYKNYKRGDPRDVYSSPYTDSIAIPSTITYNNTIYNVTSIGDHAFDNCSGLTAITIPNSVTTIGSYAFEGCSGLTSVHISDLANWCKIDFYNEYSSPFCYYSNACHLFVNGLEVKDLTIPDGVTSIGNYAFYGYRDLVSVTIPNSVTSIGNKAFHGTAWYNNQPDGVVYAGNVAYGYKGEMPNNTTITLRNGTVGVAVSAFRDCNRLTSVTIPNSVTSIGGGAFWGCSGLRTVTIPNSVTSIGSSAFSGCSGLTSITIGSSVTSIGGWAFDGCSGLTSVHILDLAAWCKIDFQMLESNPLYYAHSLYLNGEKITDLVIPNNVTIEGYSSFSRCSGLTSVTIGNGVTSIGESAFSGCSGLTSITIPSSVTIIGHNAFSDCNGLTAITIGNSVTSIGDGAFRGCSSLTSITIPSSVTSIGSSAFSGCSGLTSITIPNSVTSIGSSAFSGCSGLISTTPSSISTGIFLEAGSSVSFNLTKNDKSVAVVESGHVVFTGLDPMQEYTIKWTGLSGKTKGLTLTTSQPKVISAGNVIVAAESNLDDEETNVGFEWRRTDWTDDFASNTGGAYLYEGTMEGYIRNLYTEKLWKFRPYYESASGKKYYGDWVGLDPTNTSYFEPTVHTYARINIEGNTALVRGYALRGTDNVTVQGFMYWRQVSGGTKERGDEPRKVVSIPSNAVTVEASGQVMTATLDKLDYETTYCVVAFVKTSEGETFYGETQTFTTGADVTGIGEIAAEATDSPQSVRRGIYTLQGVKVADDATNLKTLPRGIYIVNGKKHWVK